MDKPLLSICIPTYSRAHFLRQGLNGIVSQFEDPEILSLVEIVISDNASTDNTQELVKSYLQKYSNIRYSRNASNIGFDRNVSAVLALGKGQFLWLMSDDEVIEQGALKFLLPLLKNHRDVGYFCVDQEQQNGGPASPDASQGGPDYQRFANGNAWLEKIGLTGGLISQNIFNRDFLPQNLEKYYDNLWLHYSIALEILGKHPGMLIKRLFAQTQETRVVGWAKGGLGFKTYNCLNKIVRELVNYGYDPKILKKVLAKMARGLAGNIASAKIRDLKISTSGARVLIKEYGRYPLWLVVALLVYITPNSLLKLIKRP